MQRTMWLRVAILTIALGGMEQAATAQAGQGNRAEPQPLPLARSNGSGPAVAPAVTGGEMIEPAKALNDMLSMFEKELTSVAETMPAEKYSFAPSAETFSASQGAKFEGVRTFAQQVAHLAEANYFFYSAATGLKTDPGLDMRTISKTTGKDDLLKALAASFAYAHKAVATITKKNAFEAIKPVDGQTTRATLAAFAVAHGNDHYGQMVEYLRMNGLVPPGSK